MSAPLAYTVHPGGRAPSAEEQQVLAAWLPANGINPNLVSIAAPITVLPVPHGQGPDGDPWLIQVIVFEQIHVDHLGASDHNLITGRPVTFQRTVPLQMAYPTATAEEANEAAPAEETPAPQQQTADEQEGANDE